MRRIINGRRYDTDAKFTEAVAEHTTVLPKSDFRYFAEVLYRTNHGNWFLAGEGHGMSRYGSTCDDGTRGWGERIIPLGPEEALDWLESRGETDAIEAYFADEIEEA